MLCVVDVVGCGLWVVCCVPMESIFSVQNENFSGDGQDFTKVSRTVGKAESHLY